MSLVIVTGDGPEHRYVTNQILNAHEVPAIFVCDPPARRSWSSILRKSPSRFIDKALRQLYLRAIKDAEARAASLTHVLGLECEAFNRPDLLIRVGKPKAGVLAEKITATKPDIIAVYGTGVIPDKILQMSGTVSLNMHTGLSPWYRGTACAFWPIVEGNPEMIGATVHECTSEVDGGRIFFTGRAELFRGDDLHAIFARAVKVGAKGYVDVIGQVATGNFAGESQDLSLGREFRGAMLGFRAEYAARKSLRLLSKEWPEEGTPNY